MAETYAQYEYYTAVEILLSISGEEAKTFSISQTGRYLQSLTIKEGTVNQGPQFAPNLNGDNIASGTVSLIDEDNSIFRSLLSSKSSTGNQLENKLEITLYTYSGIRTYKECRINKWDVSFNGGVPSVSLEWQTLNPSGLPSGDNPSQPEFNINIYETKLVHEGVTNYLDFQNAVKVIFNDSYRVSLGAGLTNDNIVVCGGESKATSDNTGIKTLRFSSKFNSDQVSVLTSILDEFCRNCVLKDESTSGLGWKFIDKERRHIQLTKIENYRNRVIEVSGDVASILNETVFVYNSSVKQGSDYSTPWGVKRAFIIESIQTSFSSDNIISSNLENQSNANNPNGNMIITSKGRVMLPSNLPQAVTESIHNITSISIQESFNVTITVYNFIHFYVLGQTDCFLVVFDHLGQIHPVSGRMRVYGYTYELGDGVVKATVNLKPVFSNDESSFYDLSSFYLRDFTMTGHGDVVEVDGNTISLTGSPSTVNASMMTQQEIDSVNASSSGIINTGVGTGLNVCLTLDDCI